MHAPRSHSSRAFTRGLLSGFAIAALALAAVSAAAQPSADELARNANASLRQAQRAMFSGKFDQAKKHLEVAEKALTQLKAADPKHRQLRSLEGKLARQKRDLDRRTGRKSPPTPRPGASGPKTPAAGDKLPGGVSSRLRDIDRALARGERYFSGKSLASPEDQAKTLEAILKSARGTMAEIEKRYGGKYSPDHPEVKARTDAIADFAKKKDALIADQAQKTAAADREAELRTAQCAEWMARLAPFVTPPSRPDHDETRYLIPAGTANLKELDRRKRIRDQAGVVMAAYRKASFPHGKTDELERVEKELTLALADFDRGYKESLGRVLDRAGQDLKQAAQWLDREEKKDDGKRKPLTLQKDIIPGIAKMLNDATAAIPADDLKLVALRKDLEQVRARDEKLRQKRKERTFLTPDKFKGADRDEIKKAAAGFLAKKHADAKVLRTTVISPDWKEERVVEHTDTTKTALRYRVTRSVTVQIAGKRGAEVFLYTLHVAKDRRSDGTFGPLKGHVMFTDPMLEENVKK
jgi:hypothetical protein